MTYVEQTVFEKTCFGKSDAPKVCFVIHHLYTNWHSLIIQYIPIFFIVGQSPYKIHANSSIKLQMAHYKQFTLVTGRSMCELSCIIESFLTPVHKFA
jgi:hypothetical protein